MTNPTAHGVSVFDGLVDAPSDLSAAIARVRAYIAGESSVILPGDIPAVCAAAERAAAQSKELTREERYRRALVAIEHATAPSHNDGAYHEAAHELATNALREWFCPYCNPCFGNGNEKCRRPQPPAQAEPQPVSVPYELIAHDKPQPRCGWMHAGDQCALAEGKE